MRRSAMVFLILFGLISGAIGIIGFLLLDAPSVTRGKSLDQTRISNLSSMAAAVRSFRLQRGRLPESTVEFVKAGANLNADVLKDPTSKAEYEYRVSGEDSFELCAVFFSRSDTKQRRESIRINQWPHNAGRSCFIFRGQNLVPELGLNG